MTLSILPTPGRGVADLATPIPPPEPPAESWTQAVNELPNVLAAYRLDPTQGDGLSDLLGGPAAVLAAGGPLGGVPTIVDDAGEAMRFGATDNIIANYDQLLIPHRADFNSNAMTYIVHAVLMSVAEKAVLMDRESTPSPGNWGIEVEPGGIPRFFIINNAGAVINLRGTAGDVVVGVTFAMALVIRPTSITGYFLPAGGSTDVLTQSTTITAPSYTRDITVGAYYAGQAPASGVISRIVIVNAALTQEQCESVMRPQNVTWAADVDAGEIPESANTDIDVVADSFAVYQGSPTVAVSSQPSNSTLSVVSGDLRIAAGSTAGADSGEVTINAFPVNVNFIVTDTPSSGGGDDWSNGWTGLGSSPRGWLPSPVSSADFGLAGPANQVFFGLGNKGGRDGIMYREMRTGIPVWNAGRYVSLAGLGLPANTMAIHLEWYTWIDAGGRMSTGKRFGFADPGGAGGGEVAGVKDFTTGALGLPGGWSTRWAPRGDASNSILTPNRFYLYTYMQNRRSFSPSISAAGQLYGGNAIGSNVGDLRNKWLKLNWTVVMNSAGNADGIERFWYNDNLVLSRNGIIWQENIASHPITRLWWSWMWGGTEENLLPLETFREWHGDFRIGYSSRANAAANPWPFA